MGVCSWSFPILVPQAGRIVQLHRADPIPGYRKLTCVLMLAKQQELEVRVNSGLRDSINQQIVMELRDSELG